MSDYYENGAGNRTPTYQGDKNAIWKELRKLWVRIEGSRAPETPPLEKAWSWSDIVVLTTAVDGQPWSAPRANPPTRATHRQGRSGLRLQCGL